MLKAPIPGQVKTRLARDIGAVPAADAYRKMVEHQIRQIPEGWGIHVCYAPAQADEMMRAWLGDACHYTPQEDGDLGQRLTGAMTAHFRDGGGNLIFLGGDCPCLTAVRLSEAASLLAHTDVVLTPALDGGYCLIGLRNAESHLFTSIRWSTAHVLEETRQRLREKSLAWREAPALEDVDDQASWTRAVAAFPHLASAA